MWIGLSSHNQIVHYTYFSFILDFMIAGPLGRNIEGDVSLRSPAAVYTYSKTRGLFAGISIEGSALIERKDANKK